MAELDPKLIEELKAKHGEDLHLLEHDGVAVVVKRPGKAEYRRFRDAGDDPKRREAAAETFLRSCCVHPGQPELMAMLDHQYGLVDTFTVRLVKLAGLSAEATSTPL